MVATRIPAKRAAIWTFSAAVSARDPGPALGADAIVADGTP